MGKGKQGNNEDCTIHIFCIIPLFVPVFMFLGLNCAFSRYYILVEVAQVAQIEDGIRILEEMFAR